MIRQATVEDEDDLETFLAQYPDSSMFLRSNLAAHGTQEPNHRHGTRFWGWYQRAGLAAVFGITNGGFVMCQAPGAPLAAFQAFGSVAVGARVVGVTGDALQVDPTLHALGLMDHTFSMKKNEPLYRCDLLEMVRFKDEMRAPVQADIPVLTQWFAEYEIETGLSGDQAKALLHGQERAQAATQSGMVKLLCENGRPLAMAAINAQVQDYVQVGGVFVPKEMRGQGLGRRVTSGLLAGARASGARVAVLFANNAPAARAYEAIGFDHVGAYRVAILDQPTTIGRDV